MFGSNLIKQPYFNNINYRISGQLLNSDIIMNDVFWLGVQPNLNSEQKYFLIKTINSMYGFDNIKK